MIWRNTHRVIGEIEKKAGYGKNIIFLTGDAIRGNDNFFYSLEHGLQDLSSTLLLYYLGATSRYDYFIHFRVSLDHAEYYRKTAAGFEKTDIENFLEPPKMEGILNIGGMDDSLSQSQKKNAGDAANNAVNPVSATAERLLQAFAQKSSSRIMLFFENLQWIARLWDSPQETRVLSFLLNDCAKLRNITSIVSIHDMKLLENFMEPGDEIYIGKPQACEIYYSFFRYLLRNASGTEFEPDTLDMLAHSLGAGKKGLNDCMRILKSALRKNPQSLRLADFEKSFEKGIEEKIAWADVRLERETKEEIANTVDEFVRAANNADGDSSAARRGILMWGPPGTGKTMIAKALANEKKCHFMAPSLAELKGEYVGQSSAKIRAVFAEARANQPTILFIDEADTVFPPRDSNMPSDSFSMDMVNQFLQEIDGARTGKQKIFVIAATNREHAIDNAIKSRLGGSYEIKLPGKEARLLILDDNLQRLQKNPPFSLKRAAFQDEVLSKSEGMSGRDIENFIKTLFYCKKSPLAYDEETRKLFLERFEKEEKDLFSNLKRDVFSCGEILDPVEAGKASSNIIGLAAAKEILERQAKFIASSEDEKSRYHDFKVNIPRGVLLYGPPGNGKSELVKWIAGRHGFYFFKVLSKDFVEAYPKAQIERLEKIFYETSRFSKMMQAKGIVLFFDEFDSLAHKDYMDHAVRGALLHYLTDRTGLRHPGSRIMFVAATNYENLIDEAVKRPGRIDASVLVPNPSRNEGVEILEQLAENENKTLSISRKELTTAWDNLYERKKNKLIKELINSSNSERLAQVHAEDCLPSGAELESMLNELKYAALEKGSVSAGKLLISQDILKDCFMDVAKQKNGSTKG